MARNDKNIMDNIKNMIDKVSGKTYYNPSNAKDTLEGLSKSIDSSISNIIDKNMNSNGSNLSRVYSRITYKNADGKDMAGDIDSIFKDNVMMDGLLYNYMENKYIRDLDLETDVICKYMPKLHDALEVKKDAVLSADVFSKDFMNITNITSSNDETFSANIKELQRTYNLADIVENAYMNASKYGEQFIYVLPYNKAFTDLLKDRDATNINISESGMSIDGKLDKNYKLFIEGSNINIELSSTNVIKSIIEEESKYKPQSTIKDDKLDLEDLESQESIITNKIKASNVNVPGCIIRSLNRENVIPVYIEELCLGYYYIETSQTDMFEYMESMHDPLSKIKKTTIQNMDSIDNQSDDMLKQISSKLSDVIDDKFINKNQDLRKELYFILKHNHNNTEGGLIDLKITFIPPDNMIHWYFNKDKRTNRGVSDLANSLLPAKLYSCLYITNTIGILTRSQDKRAYFVKQHIDTNISQLMLNTISQIKKSNFGMREINNMNNVLNIAGRYNDYVIPESQNGESPIRFEVIPGQDINTNDEFMEKMESMAINPIGVPIELLDATRSIEYARQLTTSNGKFARNILKRQSITQNFIGQLTTKVYNYHFNENDILESILPPPSYLMLSNTTELMRNTKDLVADILELDVSDADRDAPWVALYRKNLTLHYLSTYLNIDNINKIKERSKIEAAKNSITKNDDGNDGY